MKPRVILIGAGPSALTASIYLSRGGVDPLLIEKETIGGQLSDCPLIENYPGFKVGPGSELADQMYEQAINLGANLELDEITSITPTPNGFIAKGKYGEYEGQKVIIATGCKHRHIGAINEDKYLGKGISYCALCDGAFYNGEEVSVIGDANSALQYALLLAKTSSKVHLIALFDRFFAEKSLEEAVRKTPNIDIIFNADTKGFYGDNSLKEIHYLDKTTNEMKVLPSKGAFIAIGMKPDNEAFKELVELDKGYIVVDSKMRTKTPGVYAIGDCTKKDYRQVVTAINDGATAALDILAELSKN